MEGLSPPPPPTARTRETSGPTGAETDWRRRPRRKQREGGRRHRSPRPDFPQLDGGTMTSIFQAPTGPATGEKQDPEFLLPPCIPITEP